MKAWQHLINQRDPAPTVLEQKAANAKYQRNLNNKNEPLSPKEKWALSLYGKNHKASLKARKLANTFSNKKPWQSLIDKREDEPKEIEQKAAINKYQRNVNNKNEPLSPKEQWAVSLYNKNQKASLKAKKAAVINSEGIDSGSIGDFSFTGSSPTLDGNELKITFDINQMIKTEVPEGYQINVSNDNSSKGNSEEILSITSESKQGVRKRNSNEEDRADSKNTSPATKRIKM